MQKAESESARVCLHELHVSGVFAKKVDASVMSLQQRRHHGDTFGHVASVFQKCRGAYTRVGMGRAGVACAIFYPCCRNCKAITHPWTKTHRWSADDELVLSSMPCGNSEEAVGSKLEKEKGSIKGRPRADSGYLLCSISQPATTYR